MTAPPPADQPVPPEQIDNSPVTAPIALPAAQVHVAAGIAAQNRKVPVAMLVAAAALLVAAVLSYRHGIATNLFPPYLADGGPTPINRYSAPWIAGAAGLVMLAGLLITHGSARLVHYKL